LGRNAIDLLHRALLTLVIVSTASTGPARAMPPPPSFFRDPQVALMGTGLRDYLVSVGESIDPATAQSRVQVFQATVSNNTPMFVLQFELGPHTPGTTLGVYGGQDAPPQFVPVFPGDARRGWFTVVVYRNDPPRVLVSVFDENAVFHGTSSYPGADRNSIALYLTTPAATYFSQDARNPAGEPRALVYAGTGINVGSWWVAWEDGAPPDQDFDDSIVFMETPAIDPVLRASWSELKARFR